MEVEAFLSRMEKVFAALDVKDMTFSSWLDQQLDIWEARPEKVEQQDGHRS